MFLNWEDFVSPELQQLQEYLSQFPHLTFDLYAKREEESRAAIRLQLQAPSTQDYENNYPVEPVFEQSQRAWWQVFYGWGQKMGVLDYAMFPLLITLFLVSWTHNLSWAGTLSTIIYERQPDGFVGIWFDALSFTIIHQLGFFLLTELSIMLFYSHYTIYLHDNRNKQYVSAVHKFVSRYMHPFLWIAIMCMVYLFYVNVSAMLHSTTTWVDTVVRLMLGFSIPAITLALSHRISDIALSMELASRDKKEAFVREKMLWEERCAEYERDWYARLDLYREYMQNPESHPEYTSTLAQKIIEYYKRTKVGASFENWSSLFEKHLAAREIRRQRQMTASLEELLTSDPFLATTDQQPLSSPSTTSDNSLSTPLDPSKSIQTQ